MSETKQIKIPRELFYKLQTEVPFFHNFTDPELVLFFRLMKSVPVVAGEMIFQEYDPGNEMYILLKGSVAISKRIGKRDGVERETILATLHPGECFGELGLIDNRPRSATAKAVNNSLLLSLSLDKLLRISRNPKFSLLSFKLFRNFSLVLAQRLRESNQRVVDLTARRGPL